MPDHFSSLHRKNPYSDCLLLSGHLSLVNRVQLLFLFDHFNSGFLFAQVEWDEAAGKVFIEPHNNSRTLVNGKKIAEKTELVHQNRVWLGNNYAMRFCFPGHV